MRLEVTLPDAALSTEGGREVADLLARMCDVVRDWALATGSGARIVKKDFAPAVKEV